MARCVDARRCVGALRRGAIGALAAVLLVGAVAAQGQGPRFRSPKDEKLFWAMQDELRQISEQITRLHGTVEIPAKGGRTVTDHKPSKVSLLRTQQLRELRRRFTSVSLSAMSLVVDEARVTRQVDAERRRLGRREENLRQRADLQGRMDFWSTGRKALGLMGKKCDYEDTILLDHEALGVFPDHRFYLAKIHVPADPAPVAKGMAMPYERFIYQLMVLDCRTGQVDVGYGFGSWDALKPILDAGEVRAASIAVANRIPVASAVLWRASKGANVFLKRGSPGLSQAEIDQRFGLGRWSAVHVPAPHGVLETGTERLLLSWKLEADDFGLPPHLVFEWLRFALEDGHWLGRARKTGPLFDSRVRLESTAVHKAVTRFARALLRQ